MGAEAPPSRAPDHASDSERTSRFMSFQYRLLGAGLEAARALVRSLPRERSVAVGAAFGRLYARAHGPRTGTARTNLAIAFPELSPHERHGMLVDIYANLGRMVAETALLQKLSREELTAMASIEGLEHLEAAQKASRLGGAIVLTAHFGSFELFAAIMGALGVPLSIVHRTANNPYLDRMITGWRQANGVEVIRRGTAARGVLRALRSGRAVAMPLDQDTRAAEGVFVPFFSRPACTRDGPARLAMRFGVPVVPAFMFRVGESARHVIRVQPALELEPEGADREATEAAVVENVRRMSAAIEAAVRASPTQWIWGHRRWKTQPEGLQRPYPSKADRPLRRLRRRLRQRA